MKKSEVIITVVYLLIIAGVCSKIRRPLNGRFQVYDSLLARLDSSAIKTSNWNRTLIFSPEKGDDKKMPFRIKLNSLDAASAELIDYLDSCKGLLSKNKLNIFGKPRKNSVLNTCETDNIFFKNHLADSIETRVKKYLSCTKNILPYDNSVYEYAAESVWMDSDLTSPTYKGKWGMKLFAHLPPSAANTMLLLLQKNVYEINMLFSRRLRQIGRMGGCGYDSSSLLTIASKKSFISGELVAANFQWASYPPMNTCIFNSTSGQIKNTYSKFIEWSDTAKDVGLHTVNGNIVRYNAMTEEGETFPWSFQYMVYDKGASLSLDNYNYLYKGVENPVTLSVAGYRPEQLTLSVTGADIQKTGSGKYLIRVNDAKKVTAYVKAIDQRGNTNTMLIQDLYTRPLPQLHTFIGNCNADTIDRAYLLSQSGISVTLPEKDWDFTPSVIGFQLMIIRNDRTFEGPFEMPGTSFAGNKDAYRALQAVRPGDKLIVSDVKTEAVKGCKLQTGPLITVVQ